ncbi:MAG: NAD-dependent succinate-semialdehyde dehydrogenase [Polyangiales bacterium]
MNANDYVQSVNPATGEAMQRYAKHSETELDLMLTRAAQQQRVYAKTSFAERCARMKLIAGRLRERQEPLATLMAKEMGKPIRQGRAEVEKCAKVCEFYAEQAEQMLQAEALSSDASKAYLSFQALGVVLAVMPWNFPLWQVFRFLAPALMAGNGAVLKHASNVPGCAVAIDLLLRDAGVPEGLFATLMIDSAAVARAIEHEGIAAVTLTGSGPAGRAVASTAGKALKKTVLELGGSDPYLILGDADLEEAAEICAQSRLINSGQSCIAAKRFVVVGEVLEDFLGHLCSRMAARTMGDPLQESTDIGPQARHDLRDALHKQVESSCKRGAKLCLGGEIPAGPGAFYPATVLRDVVPGMPAYDEELFGPVAAVIRAQDEADAIRIANDSRFGLGAAVFTQDRDKGARIATEALAAGCCFVNAHVRSDPRLPFGGIKESGYGRELAHLGIREFVNQKTVYIA